MCVYRYRFLYTKCVCTGCKYRMVYTSYYIQSVIYTDSYVLSGLYILLYTERYICTIHYIQGLSYVVTYTELIHIDIHIQLYIQSGIDILLLYGETCSEYFLLKPGNSQLWYIHTYVYSNVSYFIPWLENTIGNYFYEPNVTLVLFES